MSSRGSYCEMQGYDVPLMYRAQKNHICINSDQREHFKGVRAVLKIESHVELFGVFSDGGTYSSEPSPHDLAMMFRGRVNAWLKHVKETEGEMLRVVYRYELRVDDEKVMGYVRGVYRNSSKCKSAVIRRIRRMVGRDLVIDDQSIKSRRKLIHSWKVERYKQALAYFQERVREFEERQKAQK